MKKAIGSVPRNIERVIRFLDDKNINIVSADLLELNQPTAIIVDPSTFDVTEKSPAIHNPNREISNAKVIVAPSGKALQIAFDLTISPERAPVYLSRADVRNLQNLYVGKTDLQIRDCLFSYFSIPQLPIAVEHLVRLTEAFEHEVERLKQKVEATVEQLQTRGFVMPWDDRAQLAEALYDCPLHIGAGANWKLTQNIEQRERAKKFESCSSQVRGS